MSSQLFHSGLPQQRAISLTKPHCERRVSAGRANLRADLELPLPGERELVLKFLLRRVEGLTAYGSITLHLADGHLPLALVCVVLRFLKLIADSAHSDELSLEVKTLQLLGLLNRNILNCPAV